MWRRTFATARLSTAIVFRRLAVIRRGTAAKVSLGGFALGAAALTADYGGKRTISRSQVEQFPHQAGGHGGIMRIPDSGSILKPIMPGSKGQVERNFYVEAKGDKNLQRMIPEFQGFVVVETDSGKEGEPRSLPFAF
jgi:hypothetical protein